MEEKLDSKNVQLASVTKDKGFHIYNDEEMAAVVARLQSPRNKMNDFGSQYNAALMMIQKGTNNLESWPDYADFLISISLVSIKLCSTK
jgi:hypothetical protein